MALKILLLVLLGLVAIGGIIVGVVMFIMGVVRGRRGYWLGGPIVGCLSVLVMIASGFLAVWLLAESASGPAQGLWRRMTRPQAAHKVHARRLSPSEMRSTLETAIGKALPRGLRPAQGMHFSGDAGAVLYLVAEVQSLDTMNEIVGQFEAVCTLESRQTLNPPPEWRAAMPFWDVSPEGNIWCFNRTATDPQGVPQWSVIAHFDPDNLRLYVVAAEKRAR